MQNTKFTPGPWKVIPVEEWDGNNLRVVTDDEDEWEICRLYDEIYGDEQETMAANGNLIAAAPEMYEMLLKVAQGLDKHGIGLLASEIYALLAKARGEIANQPKGTNQ